MHGERVDEAWVVAVGRALLDVGEEARELYEQEAGRDCADDGKTLIVENVVFRAVEGATVRKWGLQS